MSSPFYSCTRHYPGVCKNRGSRIGTAYGLLSKVLDLPFETSQRSIPTNQSTHRFSILGSWNEEQTGELGVGRDSRLNNQELLQFFRGPPSYCVLVSLKVKSSKDRATHRIWPESRLLSLPLKVATIISTESLHTINTTRMGRRFSSAPKAESSTSPIPPAQSFASPCITLLTALSQFFMRIN